MAEFVHVQRDGPVATILIDRPPANALSEQVGLELWDAGREVAGLGVRAAVVWGGERLFSAGADIKAMATMGPHEITDSVGALEGAVRHLEALPVPVIAAINGLALGGGCEVAIACDFRFAAEDSRLGQPEVKLGIMPGAGGTQRLPRLVGAQRARELIFSGRWVTAEEALAIGLVDRVLPPPEVYPAALEEAGRLAQGPTAAYRGMKLALLAGAQHGQESGLEQERERFRELFATEDQKEGMRAFLDKREPRFTGR
jgi:enoyl-CoA hydratase/carnithine racemase